ncbi:MAG TPA: N-acetyltransferase [Reyranella sp.]|nr:N-acetyltransferase [Reyranella sp.]
MIDSAVEIGAVETPLQHDVRVLVAELNQTLLALTPPEFCFHMTVEQMAEPSITLFERIEALARQEGLERLVVETGDRHATAWTVYERAGFTRGGPVLDYPDSAGSVFYEKALAQG